MVNRPRRRKSKDNPYTLLNIDEKGIYKVSFKDGIGKLREVEITREVYEAFDMFELEDKAQMNRYERHIEHSEIYEESLYKKAMDKPMELEDFVIQESSFGELRTAIKQLPLIQQRRIKMYYFDELTTKQIAEKENCTQHSVRVSISRGIEELKKILKK